MEQNFLVDYIFLFTYIFAFSLSLFLFLFQLDFCIFRLSICSHLSLLFFFPFVLSIFLSFSCFMSPVLCIFILFLASPRLAPGLHFVFLFIQLPSRSSFHHFFLSLYLSLFSCFIPSVLCIFKLSLVTLHLAFLLHFVLVVTFPPFLPSSFLSIFLLFSCFIAPVLCIFKPSLASPCLCSTICSSCHLPSFSSFLSSLLPSFLSLCLSLTFRLHITWSVHIQPFSRFSFHLASPLLYIFSSSVPFTDAFKGCTKSFHLYVRWSENRGRGRLSRSSKHSFSQVREC